MMMAQLARGRLRSYPTTLFSNLEDGLFSDPSDLNATKVAWRRNLTLNSGDFSAAYWLKSASLGVSGSDVSPDALDVWKTLTDSNAAAEEYTYKGFTIAIDASTYTASVGIKKTVGAVTSYPMIRLLYNGGTTVDCRACIDTTTGVVSGILNATASATDEGTYWRFSITGSNNSTNNAVTLYLYAAANTTGSTAIASTATGSVTAWGVQFEKSAVVTSYQRMTDFNSDFLQVFPKHIDFQDAAGTTVASLLGQNIGLGLDKRLGLVLGPELVDTANTAAAWTPAGTNTVEQDADSVKITFVDSASGASIPLSAAGGLSQNLVNGSWYELRCQVKINTGNAFFFVQSTGTGVSAATASPTSSTSWQDVTLRFNKGGTTPSIGMSVFGAGEIFWFRNISVRELPGNHAYQTTGASRSTVEALVNLLVASEDISQSAWVKMNGSSFSVASGVNTFIPSTTPDVANRLYQALPSITARRTFSFKAKMLGYRYLSVGTSGFSYCTIFDLQNGVITSQPVSGNGGVLSTMTPVEDGYYLCTHTNQTGTQWSIRPQDVSNLSIVDNFQGDGTSGVLLKQLQIAYGDTFTRYQKVNTATDYADVGAPRYDAFDKTDDHKIVAAGGAGTTGILLAVGVLLPSAGTARTVWSDRGTNTGYRLSIDATNKVEFSAGTGAGYTTLTSAAALTAGQPHIILAWHDGTNLNLSINNVAETPVAQGTIAAGTTSFTIGKDNGAATGYWGDRMYQLVYRKNDTSTASQRANLYSYLLSKIRGL